MPFVSEDPILQFMLGHALGAAALGLVVALIVRRTRLRAAPAVVHLLWLGVLLRLLVPSPIDLPLLPLPLPAAPAAEVAAASAIATPSLAD
ncbi:MAG: hypothetical protein AAF772_05605, partial [Acidobacteriota bacterium]